MKAQLRVRAAVAYSLATLLPRGLAQLKSVNM